MMTKLPLHPISLLGLIACAGDLQASADAPPHIILIMTDQQRSDALGCAGNKSVLTPHLDALARDGNLFTNAYSSVSSSTPARAGLLTGMSPWNHGMLGYGEQAERYPHEKPRILNKLGYRTVGIGKMHWHPQNNTRGMHQLLTDESGRETDKYFKSDYRKWFHTIAMGADPDVTAVGWNDHQAKAYQLPEHLHPTAWTGKMAVQTIKGYQGKKPLYLKISFARPHSPYDPPQRHLDALDKAQVPQPAAPYMGKWVPEQWKAKNNPNSNPSAAVGNFGDAYAINSRRHYHANITFIDEQVGDIITALKEEGMYDNALIFFLSDHGDMLGDHCLWRKTYAYEGSAGIPFIVKLPKSYPTHIKAGEQLHQPVELRDVLPTMMDINDKERPAQMDGLSLLDIYDSPDAQWRRYIDLEHANAYFPDNYWAALTDGRMKYIFFFRTGEEQLFNLESDPGEENDLSADADYQSTLKEMRLAMVKHLEPRGEDWVKNGQLQKRKKSTVYGRHFPSKEDTISL